jgi:hypothetical protein
MRPSASEGRIAVRAAARCQGADNVVRACDAERMRVFISSVRRGLETERDALPGLIAAMGHEPVRFEDFTAQNVPSREACIRGVESSDAYLLILGPHYGTEFDDAQQSATHDEWTTAQRLGLPRFVFQKQNVEFEPAQQAFIDQLGDYASGRFHARFTDATDLNTKVASALRQLEAEPGALRYEPLTTRPNVPWRDVEQNRGAFSHRAELELHVLPLDAAPLSSRILEQVAVALPDAARQSQLVTTTEALHVEQGVDAVTLVPAPADPQPGWNEVQRSRLTLLRIDRTATFTAVFTLPADTLGSVYDPDVAVGQVAAALRLAGTLDRSRSDRLVIALGLTKTSGVSRGSLAAMPRNGGSIGSATAPVRVEPDEVLSRAALDRGAAEVSAATVRALDRALAAVQR